MIKQSKYLLFVLAVLAIISCRRKTVEEGGFEETRTSGTTTILVDESFSKILDPQIEVFKSDYPKSKFKIITGNEREILPQLIDGKVKMIVMSRMLRPGEESYYRKRQVGVYTDRFAVDGIALITNATSTDTTVTVEDIYNVMKGTSDRKLVFDNANSSTVRYFMDSAKVSQLPKKGVYTLNSNEDVIKYVAENKGFIGVVGVNWLTDNNSSISTYINSIKYVGVKGTKAKKNDDAFYKPIQDNLINGKYPFLRNIYIINCEGRDGLGTGFANWVTSQRGQLIVLKSGLAPHRLEERQLNFKTE